MGQEQLKQILQREDVPTDVKETVKEFLLNTPFIPRGKVVKEKRIPSALLEAYPAGIGLFIGQVLDWTNDIMAQMLGYDKDSLNGKKARILFSDDKEYNRIRKEFFEEPAVLGRPKVETTWLHKNGVMIDVLLHARPIDISDLGKGIIVTAMDITERKQAEEDLGKTKARLEYLLTSSPAVIYSCYPKDDYQTTFMSENVKEIIGYETQDFLHNPNFWINGVHPEDRQQAVSGFHEIHEKGYYSDVYRFQHKNGTYRWMLEESKLIRDEQGNPLEIIGYWTDITKYKQAEEALRESEQRFRTIFNGAIDGILLADQESKKFFASNKMMCQILGYSHEELKNLGVMDIHPKEDLPYIINQFEKQVNGKTALFPDTPVKRKDNSVFYADINSSPLILNGKTYLMGIFRDITKRKQAEEALQESEERLRSFMNSAIESFYLLDSELNIVEVNTNALKELSQNKEDVIGKNILDLDPHFKRTGRFDRFREVIKTGNPLIEEDIVPTPRYGEKYFMVRSFKVGDGLGIMSADITERKRAEKAQEELQQRRESFVWTTSHELRTPLTVITGYCDFLIAHIDDLTKKRITNILITMKSNLNRLERLVKQVSTVVQIEGGFFKIEKNDLNLHEFLQATVERYHHLLGEQLEFQGCPEDPLIIIEGDLNRLQQVLDNIIGNAIKHTNEKHRRIKVTSEIHPNHITIEVSDNGAGIAPTNLEAIFDQFVTIPTEYSTTGTGIGLYLCRMIMEAHGGTITAQSKGIGRGAAFIIELPRKSSTDP